VVPAVRDQIEPLLWVRGARVADAVAASSRGRDRRGSVDTVDQHLVANVQEVGSRRGDGDGAALALQGRDGHARIDLTIGGALGAAPDRLRGRGQDDVYLFADAGHDDGTSLVGVDAGALGPEHHQVGGRGLDQAGLGDAVDVEDVEVLGQDAAGVGPVDVGDDPGSDVGGVELGAVDGDVVADADLAHVERRRRREPQRRGRGQVGKGPGREPAEGRHQGRELEHGLGLATDDAHAGAQAPAAAVDADVGVAALGVDDGHGKGDAAGGVKGTSDGGRDLDGLGDAGQGKICRRERDLDQQLLVEEHHQIVALVEGEGLGDGAVHVRTHAVAAVEDLQDLEQGALDQFGVGGLDGILPEQVVGHADRLRLLDAVVSCLAVEVDAGCRRLEQLVERQLGVVDVLLVAGSDGLDDGVPGRALEGRV
jgi:hypothetical protein